MACKYSPMAWTQSKCLVLGCLRLGGISRVQEVPSSNLLKKCCRSIFLKVPVQLAVAIMETTGWVCTDRVKRCYEKKHYRLISSQVCEDGNQRQRRSEQDRQNTRGTSEAAFSVLLQKEVAESVHKCYRPERNPQLDIRDMNLHPATFRPSAATQICDSVTVSQQNRRHLM